MIWHTNSRKGRLRAVATNNSIDFASPDAHFAYDVNQSLFFRKDANNYINVLGVSQLNTLGNASLLDIYLSSGNTVEPHIHQNASELVYCVAGEALVSLINPFTNQLLNYQIKPGQVANVPQGWWHYEVANQDNTHLIAIFDAPTPEVIFGSDILRLTPPAVWAHSYCLDEAKVKDTLAPITKTVVIGPPADCQACCEQEVDDTTHSTYSYSSNSSSHPHSPYSQYQHPAYSANGFPPYYPFQRTFF